MKCKINFLLALPVISMLIFNGCANSGSGNSSESTEAIKPENTETISSEESKTVTSESTSAIPADSVLEATNTTELPEDATEHEVSIKILTDEMLNTYDSYYEFSDPIDEHHNYDQRIILIPSETVYNFSFCEIELNSEYDYQNDEDILMLKGDDLFTSDELSPEKPFITTWLEIGLMPHRGISYTNKNGEVKTLYISDSTKKRPSPVVLYDIY